MFGVHSSTAALFSWPPRLNGATHCFLIICLLTAPGVTCRIIPVDVQNRNVYERGAKKLQCPNNYEDIAGTCYERCPSGWWSNAWGKGVYTSCFANCPSHFPTRCTVSGSDAGQFCLKAGYSCLNVLAATTSTFQYC